MEYSQAVNLIKNTFESEFDKSKFRKFIINLLNEINEKTFTYTGQYTPKDYRPYIRVFERMGKFTDEDGKQIDILVIQLKKESSLERARTMQRNLIGWYLNGSRGRIKKDAALAAFVAPDEEDWRFSFVQMDYELVEQEIGGVKAKQIFTPAQRFSFLVGKNEDSHTAQQQLIKILQNDRSNPTFAKLKEVFSVEPVTKRFYEEYRELFVKLKEALDKLTEENEDIREDFKINHVDTADFCKKLLGQIVFLYFLQKKGWFGVSRDSDWGSGPKNFLRELFKKEHADYNNFFDDILEPLFYEALARERTNADDYFTLFNCRIPFLNGGLFDPIQNYDWVHTDILLSDDLFSNEDETGILDVFDRYNFTVKENEPLEKEVAVDPEMLGKVFENLLEVKDRKSKGTYYTPREIVHYMCQESLINYLETELDEKVPTKDFETFVRFGEQAIQHDQQVEDTKTSSFQIPKSIRNNAEEIDRKLADVRVCDPAVGSGAFLVGMMKEVVRKREVLNSYLPENQKRNLYGFKLHAIHNCLYGVDIDPGAVEIAKLRLWLSLVVEEESIKRIKALPNLDYKIMQGNSLLEEYEGITLIAERFFEPPINYEQLIERLEKQRKEISSEYISLHQKGELVDRKKTELDGQLKKIKKTIANYKEQKNANNSDKDLFSSDLVRKKVQELKELKNSFFDLSRPVEKQKMKKRIEKIYWQLIERSLKEQGEEKKLIEIKAQRQKQQIPFFLWHLQFAEVFQEKEGFDIVIANPPYLGESGNKEVFRTVRKGGLSKFYMGKMDYFYFFIHLALNLAAENAPITFITTNYYPTADGAEKLRNDLKDRSRILKLINFNELKIFDSARGQHNMISILKKNNDKNVQVEVIETQRTGFASNQMLENILRKRDGETVYREFKSIDLFEGDKNYIRLIGTAENSNNVTNIVINRVKDRESELLGNLCNINQGVVSGCDTLTKRNIDKLNNDNNVKLGDGIFVFDLTHDRDNKVVSTFNEKEKKLLKPFFKNSEINKFSCNQDHSKLLLYINRGMDSIDKYPNIKSHLEKFQGILEDRREVKQEKINYFELQWPRNQDIFERAKICVPYRVKNNCFAFNDIDWYCRSDCYLITNNKEEISLKYLLAILNSSLFFFWLYYKGKRKGETLELFNTPLSEIPIYLPNEDIQSYFVGLAEEIEDYKQKGINTEHLELSLDLAVFKLYNLTFEEASHVMEKKNVQLNKSGFNEFDLDDLIQEGI